LHLWNDASRPEVAPQRTHTLFVGSMWTLFLDLDATRRLRRQAWVFSVTMLIEDFFDAVDRAFRERVRRLIALFEHTLRIKRRLTLEEFYQLLQLSEAIIDHGRMVQVYEESSAPYMIVGTEELTLRFRETPQAIEDALLLLCETGRAEPFHLHGRWRLKLAGFSTREDVGAA